MSDWKKFRFSFQFLSQNNPKPRDFKANDQINGKVKFKKLTVSSL